MKQTIEIVFGFAACLLVLLYFGVSLGEAVTASVLAVTAVYIALQLKTTKEIEKNQRIPAVEVYMIYDQNEKQTYFKFFNFSNIPAFVSMHIDFEFPNGETESDDIKKEKGYRIGPGVNIDTQAVFFHKDQDEKKDKNIHSKGTKAKLNITVENALLENSNLKMIYPKEYIFCEDNKIEPKNRWDEKTWGYIEPPL